MPGIVGYVGGGNPPELLARMLERMRRASAQTVTSVQDHDAAMGCVALDAEDGACEDAELLLAVAGEFGGADELWRDLSPALRPAQCPPMSELLRLRFRDRGIDGLCGLNGMYTVALWEKGPRRLHLVTDPRGFRKLCYWQRDGQLYFASRYGAFLAHPQFDKRLCPSAILEFVRFGYLLGDDTFFDRVKQAPAGTVLTWCDGRIEQRRYWDYAFDIEFREEEAAVEELARRYRRAVERRARGNVCIQITGGLDSRGIAGYLERDAPQLDAEAITIGTRESREIVYGRKLAHDLGYAHTSFYLDSASFAKQAEESVWRTEGMIINHTGWRLATDDWLAARGRTHVTHGFMSIYQRMQPDVVPLIDNPGPEEAMRLIYAQLHDMAHEIELEKLFRPEVYRAIADAPDRYIRALVDRAPTDQAIHRYDYLELHTRQRNFQAVSLDHFRPRTRLLAPLTDNEMVDFADRLDPRLRAGSRAYERMIIRHLPKTCHAPHIKTGMPLDPSRATALAYRAWGRLNYRVLPRLTAGRFGTKTTTGYAPYVASIRGDSQPFLRDCLRYQDGFASVFNLDYIEPLMEDYFAGRRPGYGPVYILNTLLLWHKLFVLQEGE